MTPEPQPTNDLEALADELRCSVCCRLLDEHRATDKLCPEPSYYTPMPALRTLAAPKQDAHSVEAIAQFLHDEGGFDDAWSYHTWPEHPDDDGQREGGFVKIVPSNVQAKFRDVARRLCTMLPAKPDAPAEDPLGDGSDYGVTPLDDAPAEPTGDAGVLVERIRGNIMPDRIWLVDMDADEVQWSGEREPNGDDPLEAVEYVRAALRSRPASDGLPAFIGSLHLSEKRASGERMCADGHVVPEGHALYWPQPMGQYDDSDAYCLTHAIEKSESEQWWPRPASDGAVERVSQNLQDHMEQYHGVGLKASEWDAAAIAALRDDQEKGT
jgi:hypothetical protein